MSATTGRARRPKRTALGVAFMCMVMVSGTAVAAYASHFRYGNETWTHTGGNSIAFSIANGWRRSGFGCQDPANPSGSLPCTGADGLPAPGDLISEDVGGTTFDFGDGNAETGPGGGSLWYLVTSVNVADDWLYGLALDSSSLPAIDTSVDHTYAAAGSYTAAVSSCCRIADLVNASGASYVVETIVNAGGTNVPPVSTLPPIVNCPVSGVCGFSVPASDANGDPLSWRFSTPAESGIPVLPGPNAPTINSANGQFTWNTNGAGAAGAQFAVQATIEDLDRAGAVKSKVAVDFIIRLGGTVTNDPPAFVSPTPGLPSCNSTINGHVGTPVHFTVKALDPNVGDSVTLTAAGVPPGATLTPILPASGNPVQSAFAWTPPSAGTSVMTFQATDNHGEGALCSITLVIAAGTTDTTPPTCLLTKTFTGPPKGIEVTARDGGPNDSGIKSIVVTKNVNAHIVIPAFAIGTKSPLVVKATRVNNSQSAQVALRVTDVAGKVTNCDPVLATVVKEKKAQVFRDVPRAEHFVTITNDSPGLRRIRVTVNGHHYRRNLAPNEKVTIDVGAAVKRGGNTFRVRGWGKGSADIMIWDGNGTA